MLNYNRKELPKLANGQVVSYAYFGEDHLHLIVVEDHTIFDYIWNGPNSSSTFIDIKAYPRIVLED